MIQLSLQVVGVVTVPQIGGPPSSQPLLVSTAGGMVTQVVTSQPQQHVQQVCTHHRQELPKLSERKLREKKNCTA